MHIINLIREAKKFDCKDFSHNSLDLTLFVHDIYSQSQLLYNVSKQISIALSEIRRNADVSILNGLK